MAGQMMAKAYIESTTGETLDEYYISISRLTALRFGVGVKHVAGTGGRLLDIANRILDESILDRDAAGTELEYRIPR